MRSFVVLAVAGLIFGLAACSEPPCDPATETCTLQHTFANLEVPVGHDDDDWCVTWTVDNTSQLFVNTFTQENTGLLHHANYYFVPHQVYDVEDGLHRCSDLGFSELGAAISGGVLFAQSTQADHEEQRFPEGVAIAVRERARVVGNIHLLNLGDAPETTEIKITMETRPPEQADIRLAPFRFSYEDLTIPANTTAEFSTTCDVDNTHQNVVGAPLDLDVYWVLPHFHSRGSLFQLQYAGGPHDGEDIYRLDGYDGAGNGQGYDPALAMAGATGIKFTCAFENRSDTAVKWGQKASDEMCMMLGFARSDLSFDAYVDKGTGSLVSQDGGVNHYTGPCQMIGRRFDP
jgi:hypothetical protein